MENLIGIKLSKLGKWYEEVVEVFEIRSRKAFVKLEADDGFVSYAVLLKNEFNEWHIHLKSSAKDAVSDWFENANKEYEV